MIDKIPKQPRPKKSDQDKIRRIEQCLSQSHSQALAARNQAKESALTL